MAHGASTPAAAPPAPSSVAVLKQVKATEEEWAERIAAARREADDALTRLRQEEEDAVKAANAAAESDRAQALDRARAVVQSEVAQILADGESAAQTAGRSTGKRPQDRRDRVLAVLLGPFAKA